MCDLKATSRAIERGTDATDLATILAMDGIVIRKIPMTSTACYTFRERALAENESVIESNGRKWIKVVKANSLGGKYLISFKKDQGSTHHFSLRYDGIGDTIEDAYKDYCAKHVSPA